MDTFYCKMYFLVGALERCYPVSKFDPYNIKFNNKIFILLFWHLKIPFPIEKLFFMIYSSSTAIKLKK